MKHGVCENCGGHDLVAWYDAPERQDIEVEIHDDGTVTYEYTGNVSAGEVPGDDYVYACRTCGIEADTIEELVGLPAPPKTSYTDAEALDRMNNILSADDWSVGMLEDLCAILRKTGRTEVASDYLSH